MEFVITRYKNVVKRDFKMELITPLFMGGADPAKAEFRVPSLRGSMRFWWRAVYGDSNLEKMKEREAGIFGDTSQKSQLLIHLKSCNDISTTNEDIPKGKVFVVKGHGLGILPYLAYGLQSTEKSKPNHEHIPAKKELHLSFSFPKMYEDEILTTLQYLSSFGGLGGRSRNGFGSVKFSTLDYLESVEAQGDLKSFTALSSEARLFLFPTEHSTWEDALSEIGFSYRNARLNLEPRHSFQRRPLLAKPLISKNEDINIGDRHAKPYFLHVDKLESGKFRGKILFMPYDYGCDPSKKDRYWAVCEDMNRVFEGNADGGVQ